MICSELKSAPRGWSLWERRPPNWDVWLFMGDDKDLRKIEIKQELHGAWFPKYETVILAPGEIPMMNPRKCHREDYP
jgi:hypothetical protein